LYTIGAGAGLGGGGVPEHLLKHDLQQALQALTLT
jgi:hypothetical protein